MDLSRKERIPRACISGLIGAIGLGLFLSFMQGPPSGDDIPEAFVLLGSWFGVIAVAVYGAGRRGFIGLWVIMLVLGLLMSWRSYPADAFMPADQLILTRGLGMPTAFWAWSALAWPLFIATIVSRDRQSTISAREAGGILISWLALLLIARVFARVAWDVLPPRYPPLLISSLGWFVLVPTIVALSIYTITKLRRLSTIDKHSGP